MSILVRRFILASLIGTGILAPALLTAPTISAAQAATAAGANGFSFAEKGTIALDVADIVVETVYQAPAAAPNVDHRIAVSPTDAVRLWASTRLKAAGKAGVAKVVVRDGSVKEKTLPRTEGVRGWFTKDQAEQYEARLEVELQVTRPDGFSGQTTTVVSRSTTVAEDVTIAEREKVMLDLVRNLIRDLDAQMEPSIKTTLFAVVIL